MMHTNNMKNLLLMLLVCNQINGMSHLTRNVFMLRMMLSTGILDPDKLNSDGTTVLHRSVTIEDQKRLELLIRYSARFDTRDSRSGWTPLHYACLKGNHIFVELLAQAGASVNEPTNPASQTRPLHITAYLLHPETTKALLEAGADPGATNIHQQTPLHETCLTPEPPANPAHKLKIASLLVAQAIQNGTNRDTYVLAQDKYGKKASDYLSDEDEELKQFLLPEIEYNRNRFYAMLAQRGMNVVQFLHRQKLGLIH